MKSFTIKRLGWIVAGLLLTAICFAQVPVKISALPVYPQGLVGTESIPLSYPALSTVFSYQITPLTLSNFVVSNMSVSGSGPFLLQNGGVLTNYNLGTPNYIDLTNAINTPITALPVCQPYSVLSNATGSSAKPLCNTTLTVQNIVVPNTGTFTVQSGGAATATGTGSIGATSFPTAFTTLNGVDATGGTDVSASFQTQLNAATAAGKALKVLPGKYRFDAQVLAPAGYSVIYADAPGTVTIVAGSANPATNGLLFRVTAKAGTVVTGFVVQNITVDGGTSALTNPGTLNTNAQPIIGMSSSTGTNYCNGVVFDHVAFQHVYFTIGTITYCLNSGYRDSTFTDIANGASVQNGNIPTIAINGDATTPNYGTGNFFTDNTWTNFGSGTVTIGGQNGFICARNQWFGTNLGNVTPNGGGNTTCYDLGHTVPSNTNIVIADNFATGITGNTFDLNCGTNISVTGNVVTNSGNAAISLTSHDTAPVCDISNVTISGNVFKNSNYAAALETGTTSSSGSAGSPGTSMPVSGSTGTCTANNFVYVKSGGGSVPFGTKYVSGWGAGPVFVSGSITFTGTTVLACNPKYSTLGVNTANMYIGVNPPTAVGHTLSHILIGPNILGDDQVTPTTAYGIDVNSNVTLADIQVDKSLVNYGATVANISATALAELRAAQGVAGEYDFYGTFNMNATGSGQTATIGSATNTTNFIGAGAFTTLSASSTVSGTGFTNYFAAAPPLTMGSGNAITPSSTAGIAGITTNTPAVAGAVGELQYVNCVGPAGTQTVTMTIASPVVVSWASSIQWAVSATNPVAWTCPIVFTTTGALPTGITAGTTYFVVGASVSSLNFDLADTAAHALACTASFGSCTGIINTSGSQSGVQTGTMGSALTTATWAPGAGMALQAGDWDCTSVFQSLGTSLATATGYTSAVNSSPTSAPTGVNLQNFSSVRYAGGTSGSQQDNLISPPTQFLISATTNMYGIGFQAFGGGTAAAGANLRCRRMH